MTLLHKLTYSGVHFAKNPSHRRSILLSNMVGLIIFGLGIMLFISYYWWYGWNEVTVAIPVVAFLSLSSIALNKINQSLVSRIWLTLLIPVMSIAISIYAKHIYYAYQEELDYFSFRFIILSSCVFPAIFFSFREKAFLIGTSLTSLLILMAHDPLHAFFGVPYQKDVLKESNYGFANVVILITWCIMMAAVAFLKWISEKSEEKAETFIRELNATNEFLREKKTEIEIQHQEISAQAENLNVSQTKLQKAYQVIEAQKNQLIHQNKNLTSELVTINKDLATTNAELIKHNNELRQFSYTVSHNLRGPVASLIGLINLIDQQTLNSENKEIYDHLKTSVSHLDTVITDLSKIIDIRNDIFHVRQKIRLEMEVQDVLMAFKKDIDAHQVMIKTDFSRCPEIYSVRPMVHSILYNLVSNAIKYRSSVRRPEIEISSDINDNYNLTVRDNGLGIDLKNHQENLFKLYKRFHFHTEGKGLGLYLVKLQAESLGGRVDVFSEVNQNTIFKVYLDQPKNIERQILYEKSHLKIFFDARINSIGMIWHGPVSSEQYRNAFIKCLEFVRVYNTPNYIGDITHQGYIAREDQQWMFQEILPEAVHYGLKRIATVRPFSEEKAINEYLKKISENLENLGIQPGNFLTMEEATEWVSIENQKLSSA